MHIVPESMLYQPPINSFGRMGEMPIQMQGQMPDFSMLSQKSINPPKVI